MSARTFHPTRCGAARRRSASVFSGSRRGCASWLGRTGSFAPDDPHPLRVASHPERASLYPLGDSKEETALAEERTRFPSTDTATYSKQEFDDGSWSVQSWLERAPWRTLRGTTYGVPETVEPPLPALFKDELLKKIYLMDIALFIGAERVSYLAVSG